jgi:DNA excision repair protein ERCC-4
MSKLKGPIPADLKPEDITILVDSREQTPFSLPQFRVEVTSLKSGDYSVKGLEHVIAVERKGLIDFLGSLSNDRERFEWQIKRLLAYPVRALIIESTWGQLELGGWKSRVTPQAAVGTALGIMAQGVPVILAGNHGQAAIFLGRFLFIAARRRWREARSLVAAVGEQKELDQQPESEGKAT